MQQNYSTPSSPQIPTTYPAPTTHIQGTSSGEMNVGDFNYDFPSMGSGAASGGLGGLNWSGALPGLISGIGGLIGGFGSPSGMDQLEQGIHEAEGTLQPYADMGVPAWQRYQQETGRMLDPNKFESDMMQGFQGSPGSEYAMGQATGMLNRHASALGITGGGTLANALQKQRQNLALQDWNNELTRRTGIFQGGTSGLQQVGTMGANASGNMANLQAQLGAAQAKGAQSQSGGMWSGIGSLAGGAAMLFGL
jgi:hypothetical protein